MTTIEEPQPDTSAYEIAGFKDRAIARIVDGFLMSCVLLMMWFVVGWVAIMFFLFRDFDGTTALLLLMVIAALVPVVLYEVHPTARRGCAVGKEIAEVIVIRWSAYNDTASRQPFPSYGQSLIRWLVPHGVLFAGLTVLWLWALSHDTDINPLFLFVGPVGWVLMYLTSLLDTDRRGLHDYVAGTVVVKAPPRVRVVVARNAPVDDVNRWDMKAAAAITAFMSKRTGRSTTDPDPPKPR